MELKQIIEENKAAVEQFGGKIKTMGEAVHELQNRLHEVEQKGAGGMRPANSGTVHDFGRAVVESEQFKALASGNAKHVKMSLDVDLLSKNTLTGDEGSPAQPGSTLSPATRMPGIVMPAERSLRIRDLLPVMQADSNLVEVTRELAFSNNAAPQASEGAEKAETDLTFELIEAPVRTIAHFIKVSKQALSDQAALGLYLDRRMRYGVGLAEEVQVLTGNGTGSNMSGLIQNATAFTGPATGDTHLDTLSRAIEQVEVADYSASGIVLNVADWRAITRLKDNEDRYLMGGPAASAAMLWGLPVVPSNSMPQGQFLVADFNRAAILWDRQNVTVEMFEQDETNVQRNLVTIRAEMRSTVTVILPTAIVHGSF
ncbi:phage major capsid protein [Thioalkalivibrio thiocyanodenitrificans]|uniref:phage major capsid protein n=1 Tax=Thioalkalivibrio thiocyanodenitrificans TaxID=243063 RepID=UPI000373B828|nr:phage major capsid protein [Thioalkalivibrio thiocyanodenitrificans]